MVSFLIRRPIAVFMAFLAAVIIGVVTYFALPVSLLPDIDIPQITVQISGDGIGARELENTATAVVRRQLLQVGGLSQLKSETRDGMGVIRLSFDYGVNTDLAFIEVNEKIDAAMNSLPRDISRPKAIKASATDIPVLYLSMTLRDNENAAVNDEARFLQMADVAENVVRRRIEQMPEIAMADITGVPQQQLRILPDERMMASLGVTLADIENALSTNNAEPGSMTVREGYYEYNVNIANQLRTIDDVKHIYIRKADRLMQLGDFCDVQIVAANPDGYAYCNGKRAVTLAIIKQSAENMDRMKAALRETTEYFSQQYPDIEFTESRNQTELLDYTISNLVQNLLLGLILVFVLTAMFMGEMRSSVVIGTTIIVAVIITFLLFYLFGVTINIISLSGLILAVGMMIDNSVIVTENIIQYRQRGFALLEACHLGTTEMITPMLSSSLTTVAVFVPLVFMSGIAGAIFADQAFAITAGLAVSYVVGIMLLPVLYRILFSRKKAKPVQAQADDAIENTRLSRWYTTVYNRCFAHRTLLLVLTALTLPLCVWLFSIMKVERMPQIDRDETVARVEWNENINLEENAARVQALLAQLDRSAVEMHSAYVGVQDYMLDANTELSPSESELYVKVKSPAQLAAVGEQISSLMAKDYPRANLTFSNADNIFDKIFSDKEADLEVRLHRTSGSVDSNLDELMSLEESFTRECTPLRDRLNLVIDQQALLLYGVSYSEVSRTLRTAFKANSVGTLRSYQQYIPIAISGADKSVERVLAETMVRNNVPLNRLVSVERDHDLKSIHAAEDGEYVPLAFNDVARPEKLMADVKAKVESTPDWEVDFAGSIFANRKMMRELTVILLVSLLLMYFILCAQFGSFVQPLIVLVEIPIDTAFALLTLLLCGHTLNLMSAIGIIVTCGIVVNDSILKLDAINELRQAGTPLTEAIHTAGVRRLRPIIMTSLTTIFAMVPMLFTHDMGSELQRPLAIAMIGAMVVGTLVSIFIIPLLYYTIYKNRKQ
jgi:multidrug efflux pump subunit AcrB